MAARSAAIAFATAGIVVGLYHRGGVGGLAAGASRGCTTSWASLSRRPTAALASNVCGSVFGLLMMALTWTYFPPTWPMTFAYSFSAPTATIAPPDEPDAGSPADAEEQALASRVTPRTAATATR